MRADAGQTLVSAVIAIALVSLLALFSATAINQITQSLHRNDQETRLVALDADVANLMALPQVCSCNFAGGAAPISFTDPTKAIPIPTLQFYGDSTCTKPDPVITTGVIHDASQALVTGISLGPFYPLGQDGTYLADLTITVKEMARPMITKVLLSAPAPVVGGTHKVEFCSPHLGAVTTAATPPYTSNQFYRYSQMSLNFPCVDNPPPPNNPHPNQSEPYVFMRTQYFWPVEEGDFLTEYESNRLAGGIMPPLGFSAFGGTAVCYEEDGVGDSVRLIVPAVNEAQCENIKGQFLAAGAAPPIDVGFSLVDNCQSRF